MKQKRVMAIAVGIDEIVGMVAYKVDGQTVIENVMNKIRKISLIYIEKRTPG